MNNGLRGVIAVFLLANLRTSRGDDSWPCDHEIFCKPYTGILHAVQTNRIFNDGKHFVDMKLKFSINKTLESFATLGNNPSKDKVTAFVHYYFASPNSALMAANLSDWNENPAIIDRIQDESFKQLVTILHERWKDLAKETNSDFGSQSTLIPLEYPFIVPGGRFREIYYWDSYWTIKGLLLSELYETVEGMLKNFMDLIAEYGHIPNGNRIYYIKRSQPPLYCQMVDDYIEVIGSKKPSMTRTLYSVFIESMATEFQFWENRMRNVTVNGETFELAAYDVDLHTPRPESYKEDFDLGELLPEEQRKEWFGHMISGAESGWDYSSRWFSGNVNSSYPLLSVSTADILPVDLNSILYSNARIIEKYYRVLENPEKADRFKDSADKLIRGIRGVLWNEENAMWYDYNMKIKSQNRNFYPSNLAPVYFNCTHENVNTSRILERIQQYNVTNFPGGVPSSLYKTEEHPQQWDFPNVWPPLVEIYVTSLEKLNLTEGYELAKEAARQYLNNVLSSAMSNGTMYEKYNCETVGKAGSGGEYEVQEGFGWSNGVTMTLLSKYPDISAARVFMPSALLILLSIYHVFM